MKKIISKKNLRIFITGGLGYIGSAFAKEALKKNHDIMLYDSLMYEQNYKEIMTDIISTKSINSSLELIIGDTRNIELLERKIKEFKPDYVLHMAELSSVYMCNHNPPFTEDINYIASKKVIDVCEKLNIPTLYNSTSSLYGNQKKMELMNEKKTLPMPTDNYCKYKLKMEDYIKEKVAKNKNFRIIIFRPATVCGVSPRMRMELLPNHFTYCAIAKGMIKISEPESYRAAINIQDMLEAYFAVMEKANWNALIYNIGHYNLSKKEFAEGIQGVVKSKIISIPSLGDLRNLQIDCSLFNKEFHFQPSISYTKTIEEIANWIQKNMIKMEKNKFAGILNMSVDHFIKTI